MSGQAEDNPAWLLEALNAALTGSGPDALGLRPETDDDRDFSSRLYASIRAPEMALVDWPADRKQQFLAQQFQAQFQHYRAHYPGAAFLVVCAREQPIGRLYLSLGVDELRLMDFALLPQWRRRGLGRQLMAGVVELARLSGVDLTLHVEPGNPAWAWYERLGFVQVEQRGVYCLMRLPCGELPSAQLKLTS